MDRQPFEMLSHTADIAVLVRGRDMAELLSNAARALYAAMLPAETEIRSTVTRTIRIDSVDADTLLVDWVNELIYQIDAEHMVFSRFRFPSLGDDRLEAECGGELLDHSRHRLTREVKAATYHMSHIECTDNGLEARIVLDV